MKSSGFYKALAAVAIASVATGMAMVTAGVAWGAPSHVHGYPVLRFNVAAGQAQLTIPSPACSASDPGCVWRLVINEPKAPGAPIVGTATGTSGTLTVNFPSYCGVIQADAQIGPAWVQRQGIRRKIDGCHTTPTTSTSTSTSTSTTTPTSTTRSTKPPVVVAASTTPTTAAPSALPFTAATTATTAATTTGSGGTTAAAAQLPFTGLDVRPLMLLGVAMVLFGGLLLSTVESRRRALRRATAIRMEHVKEGTRRTSSWFLGQ